MKIKLIYSVIITLFFASYSYAEKFDCKDYCALNGEHGKIYIGWLQSSYQNRRLGVKPKSTDAAGDVCNIVWDNYGDGYEAKIGSFDGCKNNCLYDPKSKSVNQNVLTYLYKVNGYCSYIFNVDKLDKDGYSVRFKDQVAELDQLKKSSPKK